MPTCRTLAINIITPMKAKKATTRIIPPGRNIGSRSVS
jgi:hypothetical protein